MASVSPNGSAGQCGTGFRFGDFEYDPERREVRKHGIRLRLQRQPLTILLALVESPGVIVSREELRARIWGERTFVEFEQGLNSAIKRLRYALSDSAEDPRYIERVPGEGYRFIAPVEWVGLAAPARANITSENAVFNKADGIAQPAIAVQPAVRRWRFPVIVSAIAGLLITAAGLLAFVNSKPPVRLRSDDWVLVTRFDNRTGDELLDDVLAPSLERELNNSNVVHVVPRERMQDVLALMQRPPQAPIDESTGREICLRDERIKLLLEGRAERLGLAYLVSVKVMDPRSGVQLRSAASKVTSREQVLDAIHRVSDDLRQALGEEIASIRETDRALEKVTTPSLEALRLFSQGYNLQVRGKHEGAEALFQQAVEADPALATAWVCLGWSQFNSGQSYFAAFRHALELSDKVSQRERLFILQGWYDVNNQKEEALRYGASLVTLYPDHFWGKNNQADLLSQTDRTSEAAELRKQCLRMRPDFNLAVWYWRWAVGKGDASAHYFADELKRIAAHTGDPEAAFWSTYIEASNYWHRGEFRQARIALDSAHPVSPDEEHLKYVSYNALGLLRQAEGLPPTVPYAENIQMESAFLRNGVEGLRQFAQTHPAPGALGHGISSLLYARVGIVGQFSPETVKRLGTWIHAIRGELAMNRSDYQTTICELELGLKDPNNSVHARIFISDSLATALQHTGDRQAAIRVLERVSNSDAMELGDLAFWPMVEQHLANLYRESGEVTRAEGVERKLASALTAADPDYSIAAQREGNLRAASTALGGAFDARQTAGAVKEH